MRSVLGLPDAQGHPSPVAPWAAQREIERATGRGQEEVSGLLARLRERWARPLPAVTAVREDVLAILAEHGRVLAGHQIAAALLMRRGSDLEDPADRLNLAGVCARAAIDTETLREHPRLAARRTENRVLVALTPDGDPAAPAADDLTGYALRLGERADDLASRDPLPSVTATLGELRAIRPPGAALSDTDLVALAAAASANTAVTGRLELYPRDLSPERALKLSQAVSYLSARHGLSPGDLRDRVLARFPDLAALPDPPRLRDLLRRLKYDVQVVNGRYVIPADTQASGSSPKPRTGTETRYGTSAREVWLRLDQARQRGGFVAIKAWVSTAAQVTEAIAQLDGVSPVNVTAEFVAAMHAIVDEHGKPRWRTVLEADSATVAPGARVGFARLVEEAWRRLDGRIRSAQGVVFLYDATPLARYTGGDELLARLAGSARRAGESPHGLWLLCPMRQDLQLPPRLDALTVGVIPGDTEQLVVPSTFAAEARRAS